MSKTIIKDFLRYILRRLGFKITKVEKSEPLPPLMLDNPIVCLHYKRGGKSAAFKCPIDKCVSYNGFSFSPESWNPFILSIHEYRKRNVSEYKGSFLERYYETWCPSNCGESMLMRKNTEFQTLTCPPYVFPKPWSAEDIESLIRRREQTIKKHLDRHNIPDPGPHHGTHFHGPVSSHKGQVEIDRLISVFESLSKQGYDRSYGDVKVVMVQSGSDTRFLVCGGNHRIAAMSALGYETVPAQLVGPGRVDSRDVDYWPQVWRGVWNRDTALAYVNHLFDFDARTWARKRDLALENRASMHLSEDYSPSP